jgi:predicted DNA-binding WGR domain protein/tetratricopeptide (TPR) repeat protein
MGVRRMFEFVEGSSSKFWEVWIEGDEVRTRYGKIGTAGQVTAKPGGIDLYQKLVREKTGKGYVEKLAAPDPVGDTPLGWPSEPAEYARFRATASTSDRKYVPSSMLGGAYGTLSGVPLDFSSAVALSPDDVDDWLSAHALESGWLEMFPDQRPLALFEPDARTAGTQTEIREMLCVDVSRSGCPVVLFCREGKLLPVCPSLAAFVPQLRAAPEHAATLAGQAVLKAAAPVEKSTAERAFELARGGDVDGALALLQSAVAAHPALMDHHLHMAQILKDAKRYDAAVETLQSYLRRSGSQLIAGRRLLAEILEIQGDLAGALKELDRVVALMSTQVVFARAKLRYRAGDAAGAEHDLQAILAMNENNFSSSIWKTAKGMESNLAEHRATGKPLPPL